MKRREFTKLFSILPILPLSSISINDKEINSSYFYCPYIPIYFRKDKIEEFIRSYNRWIAKNNLDFYNESNLQQLIDVVKEWVNDEYSELQLIVFMFNKDSKLYLDITGLNRHKNEIESLLLVEVMKWKFKS